MTRTSPIIAAGGRAVGGARARSEQGRKGRAYVRAEAHTKTSFMKSTGKKHTRARARALQTEGDRQAHLMRNPVTAAAAAAAAAVVASSRYAYFAYMPD